MQPSLRKWLLLAILTLAVALVWLRPLEVMAQSYVDSGLKRALVTFASARALNAALSLAQSTSVSIQVGAGVSAHPAAVLDPLDDLVEQFSTIMLMATLSFAAQHLLITMLGAWPLAALLTFVLLVWGGFIWRERDAPAWLKKVALGFMFLIFAVPLASVASEATYRLLMANEYENAQAHIKMLSPGEAVVSADEDWSQKLKRLWSQSTDIKKQVDELTTQANAMVEYIIRLAALFIMQTVVLPLLFMWLMLQFYRVFSFK
ncbi:MAG: hypothetical protein AB7S56_05260 [Halothiobacillaceae bacterium]